MAGAPARPLAPGVFRIPTMGDFINSFAFVEDDGSVTLVDAGLKRAPAAIVRALEFLGRRPSDVQRIVLTHAHFDHAGGAAEMVRRTSASGVTVHDDDAGFVESGEAPPLDTSSRGGWLLARAPWGGFAATPVAKRLHDGDVLDVGGGLRVVHTPGHTPGHVSLLHEPTGVLITGDSIFNMRSRMTWPAALACTSFRQSQQTAHVLGELQYDVVAFTHGPEIREGARAAVREFLARATRP